MIITDNDITLEIDNLGDGRVSLMIHNNKVGLSTIEYQELIINISRNQALELIRYMSMTDDIWNTAIEAAANVAEINSAANIRKLKRPVSVGIINNQSSGLKCNCGVPNGYHTENCIISKGLDDAITDELNNGPKGIMK